MEALRDFIGRMREWLATLGERLLPAERASVAGEWRQELDAAEKLLEARPEIPIAFLGPSQQGKSSLINALLGENILAVGGAVGACTCVVTSTHYRAGAGFRAEIDFISLADWRSELVAMRGALGDEPSVEDTKEDREEREAEQAAAREKFQVVYRREVIDLESVLRNGRLGLPDDIAAAMGSGHPIVIDEDKPLALRNKVRRYLVGREQSEDGQFWPLIKRVRVFGEFGVLSNGVVLVDLPGLNDPNPARELVTKRYLDEARYIWLICNSQTGIDRVFTQILRESGFFFRLFLEGRLDAFSVVATKVDDINLEVVLGQMGLSLDEFDGDFSRPLAFRRQEIANHIRGNLRAIAEDILSRASAHDQRPSFLERVDRIPIFAVSTAAYLHSTKRMPLYQGMKIHVSETNVPQLVDHLHSITKEASHASQIKAANRRVNSIAERIRSFFLDLAQRSGQDDALACREWQDFCGAAERAIASGLDDLGHVRVRSDASLNEQCRGFEHRLGELDAKAGAALERVFQDWEGIHWRSLKAAVARNGEWNSRATTKHIDFNRDIASAYLDLVPFIWDSFFGDCLANLIKDTADRTERGLEKASATITGALGMLHRHPAGLRDGMEAGMKAAPETFVLQAGQARAALTFQIEETRKALSRGVVASAASFMAAAYSSAQQAEGGAGIKRRLLAILVNHARMHAPALFSMMRRDLAEGVAVLEASMKPQLSKIVGSGERVLEHLRQNSTRHTVVAPNVRSEMERALKALPRAPKAA